MELCRILMNFKGFECAKDHSKNCILGTVLESFPIDLIVNGGRNGSGALCAEHDRKVRGPRVQTCHVVLGSCVNADSHLKNLHLRASVSKTIICSLA